jgi:hypothetical protein
VRDPTDGQFFTDAGAWAFIVDCLHRLDPMEIETMVLNQPPGKTGYVFKVPGVPNRPNIYIKLQIVSGAVRGRSFHD